jgi:hypothetical protein
MVMFEIKVRSAGLCIEELVLSDAQRRPSHNTPAVH